MVPAQYADLVNRTDVHDDYRAGLKHGLSGAVVDDHWVYVKIVNETARRSIVAFYVGVAVGVDRRRKNARLQLSSGAIQS